MPTPFAESESVPNPGPEVFTPKVAAETRPG